MYQRVILIGDRNPQGAIIAQHHSTPLGAGSECQLKRILSPFRDCVAAEKRILRWNKRLEYRPSQPRSGGMVLGGGRQPPLRWKKCEPQSGGRNFPNSLVSPGSSGKLTRAAERRHGYDQTP